MTIDFSKYPATETITDVVAAEISKLPDDKVLHYSASNVLCYNAVNFEPDGLATPICILKSAIDSFEIGMFKELQDAGLQTNDNINRLNQIFTTLNAMLYDLYEFNCLNLALSSNKHTTDLFADLIGIGHFVMNHSLQRLNYILQGEELEKQENNDLQKDN